MSDLNSILADLAAGRIDAAEAARRIDDLKDEPTPAQPVEAEANGDASKTPTEDSANDSDATESDGGRPQFATHTRESFRSDPDPEADSPEPAGEPAPEAEPRRAAESGPVNPDDLPDSGPTVASEPPKGSKGVDRVSIRAVGRRLRVIGDPAVATLSATGPHVLRRSGRVIEVTSDGDIGPSLDSFSIINPPRSFEDLRTLSFGAELVVRVNPAIAVDAEVTGGSLNISKLPVLGKIRVTAGSALIDDVHIVSDCLVQAGSATVKGDIKTGRSRIKVESGSLGIHLGKDANVTVSGEAQMGKITWPGEHGQVHEYVVGNGSAKLDIGVVMGLASVKVPDESGDQ